MPVHHLLDSASTELRSFLLVVILAHIDLNLPRGESTVVDADSGNSAVCVTTLACSSDFFTSYTSFGHCQYLGSLNDCLNDFPLLCPCPFLDSITEDLKLDVCSPSNSTMTPSMHALSNFGETLPLHSPISRTASVVTIRLCTT